MTVIDDVDAWEVLDSRGHPTVRVHVTAGAATGTFTVPAGASTGTHEAVERRDGGDRFDGLGVTDAVEAVHTELAPAVCGHDVTQQAAIDTRLVDLDGTENLARIGGNAVLGVSGAVAHAASDALGIPLYEHLATDDHGGLPMPLVNIISGGLHGAGGVAIQDFMIVPVGARSYREALEMAWAVRQGVREILVADGHRPLVADEGGFAPAVDELDDIFSLLREGIETAGFTVGADVAYAIDVAASHFFDQGSYRVPSADIDGGPSELIELMERIVAEYPIMAIEDPLAEDDWEGWSRLCDRIGDEVRVIGDDLLVTNADRLQRAIAEEAATAVLVKPNQAGTLSRTLDVIATAREVGFDRVISARSGETCDHSIADLAVACGAEHIKIGSLARSERLAKYNRLLEIDRAIDRPFNTPRREAR